MKPGIKILGSSAIAIILVTLLFTACKKDSSSGSPNTNTTNASGMSYNGAASDNMYDDVNNIAMQSGSDASLNRIMQRGGGVETFSETTTNGVNGTHFYCATVTASGSTFPVTLTVDFGTGCTSLDGISRSGSITYVFSGRLHTPGTVISATFNNYKVNGYQLGGTYSITNSSTGSTFSLTTAVVDGSIVYPNDSSYSFSGTKNISLVSGDSTDLSTYVFSVTGGYAISNSAGESLVATITTPIIRKLSCLHAVAGITAFVYTKGTESISGTLDYGDGACDNTATVKIGAYTKIITLP